MHSPSPFSLGKQERLKSRKLIDQLFKDGKRINAFPFRVIYTLLSEDAELLQAGFGVSSRTFKKAVDRNRIKRLTKEGYRLQKQQLAQFLQENNKKMVVFFMYTGKEIPDYNTVYQKTGTILEKLITAIHENNSPTS